MLWSPMYFLGYPSKGIAHVSSSFGHKQYPFTCQKNVMEPNVFLGYFERGIACSLSIFGHEQYPSNSLDQNNSAHGFYIVAQ
jgi:hypothetical protein